MIWLRRILLFAVLPLGLFLGGAAFGFVQMREIAQNFFALSWRISAPEGIDERGYRTIGGVEQFITIRSQDTSQPLLIYLHGGPGGALSDVAPYFQKPWEDFFTVVNWDQRGAGRSAQAQPTGPITVERMRDDAIDLIEQMTQRFGQRKVVLVGSSWGTLLGHEVVKARPDLVHAFIAVGIVTGWPDSFVETQRLLTEEAQRTGDAALAEAMKQAGPPPSESLAHQTWIQQVQAPMLMRGHSVFGFRGGEVAAFFISGGLVSPSMPLADIAKLALNPPKLKDSVQVRLHDTLNGWRLERATGYRFEAPIVWVQGAHDWQTPTTLAQSAYPLLCAPWRAYETFPHSAHYVLTEEPGRFLKVLLDYALPATRGEMPPAAQAAPCASDTAAAAP